MLRDYVAKRISRLKESGIETPLIHEMSVSARIIKQDLIEPYVGERGQEIIGLLKNFPSIAYGTAYGEMAGQWYRVTYLKPISSAEPVCVAEGRTGTITSRTISRAPDVGGISSILDIGNISSIPTIVLPSVTIPKVGIRTWHCKTCDTGYFSIVSMTQCPRCGSYTTEELTAADRYEKAGWYLALWNAKRTLGDWTVAFNWMRDAIATVFAWFGYFLFGGSATFVLADALSAQTDQVRSSVQSSFNTLVGDLRSKLSTHVSDSNTRISDANSRLKTHVNNINTSISNINSKFKSQIDYVTDAVNLRLSDLYTMWGIPSNMAITPAHMRNCTNTGFEFQSYGKTTIHYVAVGRSQ